VIALAGHLYTASGWSSRSSRLARSSIRLSHAFFWLGIQVVDATDGLLAAASASVSDTLVRRR
jgi:hypothetical protein